MNKEKTFIVGYYSEEEYENENGKVVLMREFIEVCELKSIFNKEKTLNIFISKNKNILKDRNINSSSLIIEELNNISFNEMVNTFKSGGLK